MDITTKEELVKIYKDFFENIKNGNSFYRLGKVFKTSKQYYFYDLGTGKIFNIDYNTYNIINCLFEKDSFDEIFKLDMSIEDIKNSLEEIKESILKENILLAPPLTQFSGPQSLSLENHLETGLTQLTLEVTEQCNLRCKYCIYQDDHDDFREFSDSNMSFETAIKAIDFVYAHSDKKVYISFYGGEPLIRIDFIKKCTEYAKEKFKDKEINFALTTNGVLISEDIAKYFADNNFSVTISLDGPQEIHDENRIFKNGKGSFEYTIKGMKNLIEAYDERAKYFLFISMVTTGPNYKEKFDKIQEFLNSQKWLPDLIVNPAYASYGRYRENYIKPSKLEEEKYLKNLDIDPLIDWYTQKQNKKFNEKELLSNNQMKKNLHIIHRRNLMNEPMKEYYFNGCCVPGGRRLHINTKGDFLPCERVGQVPYLGNVEQGFDFEKIKKFYVNDFMEEAVKYCQNCWAAHLCTNCYVDCYDSDKLNFTYRHRGCRYIRYMLEKNLILYHEILENDPESLEPLNEITVH